MTEKQKVKEVLYKVLDDFNRKWTSHEEQREGIDEHADSILDLFEEPVDPNQLTLEI